jgi:hypothetical protein
MTKTPRLFLLLAFLTLASPARAEGPLPLSAARLARICESYRAAMLGQPYDMLALKQCEAYMQAFGDSMIIAETFAKRRLFCPESPPFPADLAALLERWVTANLDRAHTTTAAVALLGALAEAHPCTAAKRK